MSDDVVPPYLTGDDVLTRIKTMMEWTPQGRALGLVLERYEGKKVWARVPYRADLVGDPETGIIAGGVITTCLDQLCGLATILAMQTPSTVATIDIRIDYMRGAIPGRDVWAEAECIKVGRNVAFVQAIAYEDDANDPIARGTATFMVNAHSKRRIGSNLKPPRT